MKNKKIKKPGWLVLNILLFLVIAVSVLAVKNQSLNIGKKATVSSFYSKLSPGNDACLNTKKVNFSFIEGVDISTINYPHDAFFAVYDTNGKIINQSNWLTKAISKYGQIAQWTTTLPADGRYSWRVRTRDKNGTLSAYDISPFAFSIDTTPPTVPQCLAYLVNRGTYGSPEEQFLVRVSWEPGGTDTGCGSAKALLYQVQVSVNDPEYSKPCASTYWSKATYEPGQSCRLASYDKGYARVRARDGAGNFSPWAECHWPY